MEHNHQLIQIINQLNTKEARRNTSSVRLELKTNTVRNLVEDIPETSDILKSYLKKFKSFKTEIEKEVELEDTHELDELLDTVATQTDGDFERYSKKDSRVFRNKAKRSETQVTNMRWKQYSNSKANLTTDSKMAPLRLERYSS
jgi:hypothetical protein